MLSHLRYISVLARVVHTLVEGHTAESYPDTPYVHVHVVDKLCVMGTEGQTDASLLPTQAGLGALPQAAVGCYISTQPTQAHTST